MGAEVILTYTNFKVHPPQGGWQIGRPAALQNTASPGLNPPNFHNMTFVTSPRIRSVGCIYADRCVYAPDAAYTHMCLYAAVGAFTRVGVYTRPRVRIRG